MNGDIDFKYMISNTVGRVKKKTVGRVRSVCGCTYLPYGP